MPGPGIIIYIILAGVIASFSALSFAEMSEFLPKEGGGYEFIYELLSPFAGFLSGWMWIFSNIFIVAVVSIGFKIIAFLSLIPFTFVIMSLTPRFVNRFGRPKIVINNLSSILLVVLLNNGYLFYIIISR